MPVESTEETWMRSLLEPHPQRGKLIALVTVT
jgi:hypothetical protein